MKNLLAKISLKLMAVLPAIAMALAVSSVDAACFCWSHQPDVPEELLK